MSAQAESFNHTSFNTSGIEHLNSPPTSMPFEFITELPGSGRAGNCDRRVIRSHVMRGRNAGRSRPRRPLSGQPSPRVLRRYDCPGCSEAIVGRRVHSCACHKGALDMRRPIWNDLALVSLPYQVGSNARLSGLIHECQSPSLGFT